jgi:putative ABC transport system permease protein
LTRPAFPLIFGGLLPEQIELAFPIKSVFLTLLIAVATSLLISWPLLTRLKKVRAADLFQASGGLGALHFSPKAVLSFAPALVFYWLIACWQSDSLRVGSAFLGIFLGSALFILGIGFLVRQWSPNEDTVKSTSWRLALLNLYRHLLPTVVSFTAIAMGVLLTSIVPQVKSVLHQELLAGQESKYPSMFMIDIQSDQLEPLKKIMENLDLDFQELAPMVRGRLLTVNGKEIKDLIGPGQADESRSDRRRRRRLSREFNFTYGDTLRSSEKIVAGQPFSPEKNRDIWQVSFEEDFASDAGLALGDQLEFDVLGIVVTARISSLRTIDWTSFHPNFFVRFEDGPLNEAPQTYVATIPPLPLEERNRLQEDIVSAMPNISVIDITRSIDRVLGIAETIAAAISFMAFLCLCAGLGVLISIASFNAESRRVQVALLKTLGANFRLIRLTYIFEFGFLGLIAAVAGTVISVIAAYGLCYVMFDEMWVFSWREPLFILIATPLAAVIVGAWSNRSALRTKPQELLSEL